MAKLVEIKTKATTASVEDFIAGIVEETKRNDTLLLLKLFQKVTKEKPTLWGNAILGFGSKVYESATTGRQVAWFKVGFSPRKANISLHLVANVKAQEVLLKKLGKHKTGAGCIYINHVKDIDLVVLEELITLAMFGK